MSVPKKHHYVPQFILRKFADNNDRLLVHRTDRDRQYSSSVTKLAHTNRGHTLYWPDREPDHVTLEKGMSEIEGAAAKVVDIFLQNRQRKPNEEQREVLGFLIALQWHRSRLLVDLLQRSVLEPGNDIDELARSIGIRPILYQLLFPWYARSEGVGDPKELACHVVDWLGHGPWEWRLYRPASGKLVVGDNLVCMHGVAEKESAELPAAWTQHGMGVGFHTCARITVPLAPALGLIVARRGQSHARVTAAAFNRSTVFNSREFVAHHPGGLPDSDVASALSEDIRTQRYFLPIFLESARIAAEKDARAWANTRPPSVEDPFS